MNKLVKQSANIVRKSADRMRPGDRRISKAARPPFWRRGTLVLIA